MVLRELFPGHFVTRFCEVPWTARSQFWTSRDRWPQGGYLESKVFTSNHQNIAELKQSITIETAGIPQIMLGKVTADMQKRWEAFVDVEVQPFSDIIYHE